MNVVVDGLMTAYDQSGKGKVILMLHGWGDKSSTFKELASSLSSTNKVIAVDLPGFGGSQPPPIPWGLKDYSRFIKRFIEKIDVKNIELVIGHSFGGSVAMIAAGNQELKPDKLVLISAAGVRRQKSFRKQSLKLIAKTGKVPLKLLPASKQRDIRERFYQSVGSDRLAVPQMQSTYGIIIKEDVRPTAQRIKIPTLIINGKDDDATPVSDARKIQQVISGSKLEVLEGSHFIHQEQAKRVSELVQDFLK